MWRNLKISNNIESRNGWREEAWRLAYQSAIYIG